jgi:UDP-N-acetylmuramate: L-alanyl-gamma-D-glutamyl-meso-diaminopimelate ligase
VYDDFAHHPTAVEETLTGLRLAYPDRRIWAVFEPRSATSCRRVFQSGFERSFEAADEVIIAPVFRSSLPPEQRLSVEDLVEALRGAGKRARQVDGIDGIVDVIVRERRPGDLVVCMSNGAFGGIHEKLLQALRGSAARR